VKPVDWSPRAVRALFDVYDYIAADSSEAAARVVDRIRAAVHLLRGQPMLGRVSAMRNRRELVVDQYVITYQAKRDRIQILTLEHGTRRR
jgi:plasmid stabilization system protein ParE